MNLRQAFLTHVGQTSEYPMCIEVDYAEGMYIYSPDGKKYLDMDSGISVSNLGHRHPAVVKAIKRQLDKYLHTMVYGEHIQSPQVRYALKLTALLDPKLNAVYYTNCGTEAVEVAIKLARKATGRSKIISCKKAYHGSTLGAESLRSDTEYTMHFMPGIPEVYHIPFNDEDALQTICDKTACIILEPIQAEAGIRLPLEGYLKKVRERCDQTGTLMILDEIQTGFGRTGHLFAHQWFEVVPDMLLIAKGMGGGMPTGAVVASKTLLDHFIKNPSLGHITTFGGHPVCIAAAEATLDILINDTGLINSLLKKSEFITGKLHHPLVKEIRSAGFFIAVELISSDLIAPFIHYTTEHGVLLDFFLFDSCSFRIAPPLIADYEHLEEAIKVIRNGLDNLKN
jgi:acetylornithine/succinyldiaminopimelate/putrescine aminotransferase